MLLIARLNLRIATLTDTSADPIQAPLALHITGITPASVTLDNPSGIASDEHPYVAVPLPTGELAPGTTVADVVLRFRNPSGVSFTFTESVLGTAAADCDGQHHVTIPKHGPLSMDTRSSFLNCIAAHHGLSRTGLLELLEGKCSGL